MFYKRVPVFNAHKMTHKRTHPGIRFAINLAQPVAKMGYEEKKTVGAKNLNYTESVFKKKCILNVC